MSERKLTSADETSSQSSRPENDGSWAERAACLGRVHDMFPAKHKDITYIAGARKICAACPVRDECLEYALTIPATDNHGVWAGRTPRQLAQEQQRRGIVAPTEIDMKPTLAALWSNMSKGER